FPESRLTFSLIIRPCWTCRAPGCRYRALPARLDAVVNAPVRDGPGRSKRFIAAEEEAPAGCDAVPRAARGLRSLRTIETAQRCRSELRHSRSRTRPAQFRPSPHPGFAH